MGASVADYEYDCCEATATSLAATHLAGFNGELMPFTLCTCETRSRQEASDAEAVGDSGYHCPAEGSSSNCFRDRMKRKHSDSVSRSSRRSRSDEVDNCRIGVRLRSVSRCRRQSRSASKKWQRCSNRVRLIPRCGHSVQRCIALSHHIDRSCWRHMIHELEYVYSRQQQASGRMLQNQHLEHNISSGNIF